MATLKDAAQGSGEADEAATADPSLYSHVGTGISEAGETKSVPRKTILEIDDPPKLPPLKLRSTDRCINCLASNLSLNFLSGGRGMNGIGRPSVSQGIVDNRPDLGSGYGTAGEGQLELPLEFGDECRDADAYDNDDDPGYHRHPIEDEEWFLEHEIEYPSEDDLARPSQEDNSVHASEGQQEDDEDGSLVGDSYFSGEEFYRHQRDEYGISGGQDYEGSTQDWHPELDADELALVPMPGSDRPQEAVHSFQIMSEVENGRVISAAASVSGEAVPLENSSKDDGLGGSSENTVGFSKARTGRGPASANRKVATQNIAAKAPDTMAHYDEEDNGMARLDTWAFERQEAGNNFFSSQINVRRLGEAEANIMEFASGLDGFSFPSPSITAAITNPSDSEPPWLTTVPCAEVSDSPDLGYSTGGPDDTLAAWRRRSSEVYPFPDFENSSLSGLPLPLQMTFDGQDYAQMEDQGGDAEVGKVEEEKLGDDGRKKRNAESEELFVRNAGHRLGIGSHNNDIQLVGDKIREESTAEAAESDDDEVEAVQEQLSKPRPEENEFETFYLKIVHRKNRTGFEEDKDFPVVINSVIAGRYHVTEYLGSAAFSKAIQAHDLHTGMDVCMKIIKNNKDFFDQSLDEIKLLKFINKHDPGDNHHVLRLYDYFYHCEHLFIVCELLRANLYEFQKYNRESGGEVYFTMPRLQSITRQCLDALEFIHKLGLIHCDLKPENILVKSYSRCEVKVIDLGSSCFQTDHLCSYVQSRSYRAPEVILGLPYSEKIDIWSLGCILAELCSGNVLFQNESLATLLARIIGILGPIHPEMLARGRDAHKYFTRHYALYERNQETEQLEYILPKKTSLAHRLPMGDEGFVDFVRFLLEVDPHKRPSASEARKHSWLSYVYEPSAGGYLATED